jgi:endonuclease/exonuclease/phosphatase family metal-dependent hydrolase
MKHVLIWGAVTLVACNNEEIPLLPTAAVPDLRVASYNLYLGAELEALFSAMPTGATLPAEVSRLYDAVVASDPAGRMDAVAALLAAESPDVVGLQEATLWRTQASGDGPATPASEVAFDFSQLIIDGLARRGLDYRVAATIDNADLEAPDSSGRDVRFTDRDMLLVRADLAVAGARQGHFDTQLQLPTAIGTVSVTRGWVSIDVDVRGQRLRVMSTHLEAFSGEIRAAQAAEILVQTADDSEMLLLGDFNFGPGSLPYETFDLAELDDAGDVGPTCCQDADLRNPESKLSSRVDLVFERGAPAPLAGRRLGADPSSRTASGVWPSDHAGVVIDFAVE